MIAAKEELETPRSFTEQAGSADHFYWLDWLRFFASLMVVLGHARGGHFVDYESLGPQYHSWFVAAGFALSGLGHEAVILFFVLSGFLVGGRSASKALSGKFDWRAYGIDRFSRIYVPLFPALILTGVLYRIRGGRISIWEFLGNLLGLQGVFVPVFGENGPLWSLAYEIWFYILWGGILTVSLGKSPRTGKVAWIIVLVGLSIFTRLDPLFLFCWGVGALAYFYKSTSQQVSGLICAVIIVVNAVILTQLTSDSYSLNMKDLRDVLPSHSVAILFLSIAFSILVKTVAGWKPRSDAWRYIERLGTPPAAFSYTLYLSHFAVIGVWEVFIGKKSTELNLNSLSTLLLELVTCLLSAFVFYSLFEKHTSRVRSWLSMKLGSRPRS